MKIKDEDVIFNQIKESPVKYIRYYRKASGYTQEALAAGLTEDGVSLSSVQSHEYGVHSPRTTSIRLYAKFFAESGVKLLT